MRMVLFINLTFMCAYYFRGEGIAYHCYTQQDFPKEKNSTHFTVSDIDEEVSFVEFNLIYFHLFNSFLLH